MTIASSPNHRRQANGAAAVWRRTFCGIVSGARCVRTFVVVFGFGFGGGGGGSGGAAVGGGSTGVHAVTPRPQPGHEGVIFRDGCRMGQCSVSAATGRIVVFGRPLGKASPAATAAETLKIVSAAADVLPSHSI